VLPGFFMAGAFRPLVASLAGKGTASLRAEALRLLPEPERDLAADPGAGPDLSQTARHGRGLKSVVTFGVTRPNSSDCLLPTR
jgi:hypothetical protein